MKRFLVLLFPGFEEIETFIPIDLLRRAKIEVVTCTQQEHLEVCGAHSIACYADKALNSIDFSQFDGLFIPGGPGVFKLQDNPIILELIQSFFSRQKWIAAICAAPIVLKKAGCLPEHFTAHSCVVDQLTGYDTTQAVVVDGNIITGRGPGAAFPFAFEIIQRLTSKDIVLQLKAAIYYEK